MSLWVGLTPELIHAAVFGEDRSTLRSKEPTHAGPEPRARARRLRVLLTRRCSRRAGAARRRHRVDGAAAAPPSGRSARPRRGRRLLRAAWRALGWTRPRPSGLRRLGRPGLRDRAREREGRRPGGG